MGPLRSFNALDGHYEHLHGGLCISLPHPHLPHPIYLLTLPASRETVLLCLNNIPSDPVLFSGIPSTS